MGAFEELHAKPITGSLAMYDRMIFKGQCATRAHAVSGYVDGRTMFMVA